MRYILLVCLAIIFGHGLAPSAQTSSACEDAYHSIMNDLEVTGEPVSSDDLNFALMCEKAMNGKVTDPGASSPSGIHPRSVESMKALSQQSSPDSDGFYRPTLAEPTPIVKIGGICKDRSAVFCFDQGLDYYDMAKAGTETLPNGEKTAMAANARFQRLCKMAYTEACPYAVTVSRDMLRRPDLERSAYDSGCQNGDVKYCGAGYMLSSNPDKGAYSLTFAKKFAEHGCALSDTLMCTKKAELENGTQSSSKTQKSSTPQTPIEQAREAEQACLEGDIEWGCTNAGLWYGDYSGKYPHIKNIAKAQKYSDMSCKAGFSEGCVSAAVINNPDNGYPANPVGLETAFRQTCLNAPENYCDWGLYGFTESAYGLTKSPRKAIEFATISCDRFGDHCYHAAAFMYAESKNQFPHRKYAEKACDQGEAAGCVLMAKSLFDSGDDQRAYAFLDNACHLGQKSSCTDVARFRDEDSKAAARKSRLDAEYERCRGGCLSSTAAPPLRSSSSTSGWGSNNVRWGSTSGPSHEAKERYKYNSCMSNRANWGRC